MFDWFWILTGGAWLVKETVNDMRESSDAQRQSELVQAFVKRNSDIDLEKKIDKILEDPSTHQAAWEYLEKFKRDHPLWCYLNRNEGITKDAQRPVDRFGWCSIGHERPELYWSVKASFDALHKWEAAGHYGLPSKDFDQMEREYTRIYRVIVGTLILNSRGKLRKEWAHYIAMKRYPLKVKRKGL